MKTNQSYIISRIISWPHLISNLWLLKEAKRMQRSRRSSECQILSAFLALGCLLLKRVQSKYKGKLYVHLFEDSRQLKFNKKRNKWGVNLFQCMYLAYLKIGLLDKVMEVSIKCGTHRLQNIFDVIFSLYNCDFFLIFCIWKLISFYFYQVPFSKF